MTPGSEAVREASDLVDRGRPTSGAFPPVTRDEASEAFFDAAARGVLLVRRCTDSGDVLGPQARTCHVCGSTNLEPFASSGGGTLVTWAVVRQAPLPALAGAVPYVTAVVELAEGPWLLVRLVDTDMADLRAGLEVEARFINPEIPAPDGDPTDPRPSAGPADGQPGRSDDTSGSMGSEALPVFAPRLPV